MPYGQGKIFDKRESVLIFPMAFPTYAFFLILTIIFYNLKHLWNEMTYVNWKNPTSSYKNNTSLPWCTCEVAWFLFSNQLSSLPQSRPDRSFSLYRRWPSKTMQTNCRLSRSSKTPNPKGGFRLGSKGSVSLQNSVFTGGQGHLLSWEKIRPGLSQGKEPNWLAWKNHSTSLRSRVAYWSVWFKLRWFDSLKGHLID